MTCRISGHVDQLYRVVYRCIITPCSPSFFSERQHIFRARYMLSPVRLSVRLSHGLSVKKVKVRIMQLLAQTHRVDQSL